MAATSNYGNSSVGGVTFSSREVLLRLSTDSINYQNLYIYELYGNCVHEFLHTTEFWFRNILRFNLPYDTTDFAVHVPVDYGYIANLTPDMTYQEKVDEVDYQAFKFYSDWLSGKIRDPKYGEPGHSVEYLGIPAEAWSQSPTSSAKITLNANNGTSPNVVNIKRGESVQKPANPVPPSDDLIFRGWYTDPELKNRVSFPFYTYRNITFYAKWGEKLNGYIVPSDNAEAYIDLSNETLILPENFVTSAYSIDGEKKWKTGTILNNKFPNLLTKDLILYVTNSYNKKLKRPDENAETIKFEKIQARPKTNALKLKANYAILSDNTGQTPGSWTLSPNKSMKAIFEGYQIVSASNKKTPDLNEIGEADWQDFPENGVLVQPYGSVKLVYLIRTEPICEDNKYIPSSKSFKITPANQAKAPKYNVDKKTGEYKLKKDDIMLNSAIWKSATITKPASEKFLCQ